MTGKCAGCGKTGQPKPLGTHVTECPDWLALPPDRQLAPEAEYRRWIEQDRDTERERHRDRAIAATTAAHAAVGARFARSRDLDAILDEEVEVSFAELANEARHYRAHRPDEEVW